jgi:hypothetical protein
MSGAALPSTSSIFASMSGADGRVREIGRVRIGVYKSSMIRSHEETKKKKRKKKSLIK